ncbi:MAG: hypothetical protein IJX99_06750 [Clostridia bacterium]|nr:hypothetical protein [Clostridia bacterium]
MENKENKKEVEKMGAFIDQVQKNNAIQREQLTYKKQKQLEKEAKQQEKEEMLLMQKEVQERLSSAIEKFYDKNIDTYTTSQINDTFLIIENRDSTINQLFKTYLKREYAYKIYYKTIEKIYKEYRQSEEAKEAFAELEEEKRAQKLYKEEQKKEAERQEKIKNSEPREDDIYFFFCGEKIRVPLELATPYELEMAERYKEHYEKVVKPTNEHFRKLAEQEKRQKKLENFRTTLYVLNWVVNILLLIFCLPLGLLFCFLTAVGKSKNNNKF